MASLIRYGYSNNTFQDKLTFLPISLYEQIIDRINLISYT
jgi:hypothetical protein